MSQDELLQRITVRPEVFGGKPIARARVGRNAERGSASNPGDLPSWSPCSTVPERRPTPALQINPDFVSVLQSPLAFKLAASFSAPASSARRVSFTAAAALAGLGYYDSHHRLKERFGRGFVIDDLRLHSPSRP